MLYYPINPDKSFVKRVIAEEGDIVRIVDGRVYVNDVPMRDDFVPPEYRSHDDYGPAGGPRGLLLRDGRPPEQQLRQPPLGHGAEEVHHRQGADALVAGAARAHLLSLHAARRADRRATGPSSSVLVRVLFLNLAVAVAKIVLGYSPAPSASSPTASTRSPTRSRTSSALVGVRIARKPPDADHPYGHRKFETMASVGIIACSCCS